MSTIDKTPAHIIRPGENPAKSAARALLGLIGYSDEHYSCTEADAFAALIEQELGQAEADAFLRWHAEGDDGGDDHYDLRDDRAEA